MDLHRQVSRLAQLFVISSLGSLALAGCRGSLQLARSDAETVLARHSLDAPDPGAPGPWKVLTLYYGSGEDKNRAEYRDSVSLITESVDASKLVSLGGSARERNGYWGFTPKEMPINGRVWYPDGEGSFPLVLVVHGNHDMRDFSDPGYDYLGELLASRGFILASVDMNFINGGIRGENDARGWFLLKHLQAWEGFNEAEDSPFRGKVDMSNIGIMGHSRGGEAVGHATAFNRLDRYPDDASLTFDFGFDIKAVVAIAPVDGQYMPTGRPVPVKNVSYLTFHGSHDGDVTSFAGLRQYNRVTFDDGEDHFKAALYMYRANHGQWNTVWGAHDNGPRSGRVLDLRTLIEPEAQRRFAEIYVTAFLEATLKGDGRWLPIFRDHRVIGDWLPPTMYVTRLHDASFRPLATFEEDIDVTSGTESGVRLRGDSLATWKEEALTLRGSSSSLQDNQALRLAWNNRLSGRDTTRHGPTATFTLSLPEDVAARWELDGASSLQLLLSGTERIPGPRRPPEKDSASAEEEEPGAARPEARGDTEDEDESKPPVDLSVELEDASGVTARVPLSAYGPVRRPLETRILRRSDQEASRFANLWEMVLQSYTIPLSDFTDAAPRLDLGRLTSVRLVFDRVHAGEVVVDDIGFSRLPSAFWADRR